MKMVFKTRGDIEMLKKLILIMVIVAVAAGIAYGVNLFIEKQGQPKVASKNLKEEIAKFNTPYFIKINMTPEQKKIHDECLKEKNKAIEIISDKKAAVRDELNKVKSSSLPQVEKNKKTADLNKQMNDLNAQSEAIEAKGMDKFENSLNPAQKAEYEKFKADFAKKYGPKK